MARPYFYRLLKREQINTLIDMVNQLDGVIPFPHLKAGQETYEMKAPDGDVVLAALAKGSRGPYIVRLHREVFDEGIVTESVG